MSSRMSYKWNIIQHKLFSVNLISFHMFLRFISVGCIKNSFLFENLINCFFPLHWVFGAAHGLSLAAVRQGCSSLWCAVSSLRWLLLLRSSSSRVQVQQLWCTGLAAPWSERSSQTRDWTCVPCIGRWILNHWTNRGPCHNFWRLDSNCSYYYKHLSWKLVFFLFFPLHKSKLHVLF